MKFALDDGLGENLVAPGSSALHGLVLYRDTCVIAGVIPESIRLHAQLTLASLGRCHKSGECAKSCARRSVCLCSQSGGGASIGLLT